ncbi:hypothetical protein C8T65DRAFT_695370 [Cerioporus squamosus]|nr:hypothetical protein C8T65DRAFT_695370 [Cerioporus squamosus]
MQKLPKAKTGTRNGFALMRITLLRRPVFMSVFVHIQRLCSQGEGGDDDTGAEEENKATAEPSKPFAPVEPPPDPSRHGKHPLSKSLAVPHHSCDATLDRGARLAVIPEEEEVDEEGVEFENQPSEPFEELRESSDSLVVSSPPRASTKRASPKDSLRADAHMRCDYYIVDHIPLAPPSGYERDVVVRPSGTPGMPPSDPQPLFPPVGFYRYKVNEEMRDLRDIFTEMQSTAEKFPGGASAKFARLQRSDETRSLDDVFSETTSITHIITVPATGHVVHAVTDPAAMKQWVTQREEAKRSQPTDAPGGILDDYGDLDFLTAAFMEDEGNEDMEEVDVTLPSEADFNPEEDVEPYSAHRRVSVAFDALKAGFEDNLSSDYDWNADDEESDAAPDVSWQPDEFEFGGWEDDRSRF